MIYKQLGNSDIQLSEIAMGCMSLTTNDTASQRLLQTAFEKGITYFDTADLYEKGENEKLVGTAVKAFRKDIAIATKVGNQWRPDGSGWDWNPRKQYILDAVEASLRRLQTDYIDLYQLHGGTIEDSMDETIEAFEQLQQEGKIRYYGISSIRPNVIRAYADRSSMASVMLQHSLLDRRAEEFCVPFLQDQHVGILARGVVAKGLLADKPSAAYLSHNAAEVEATQEALQLLSDTDRTSCQTSIRYTLASGVTAAVLGMRTLSQLAECVAATDVAPLTPKEMSLLQQCNQAAVYTQHR